MAAPTATAPASPKLSSALAIFWEKCASSFVMAVRSLWLHKMRAFLSVLGIIIGTAAVITLMAFGEGSMQDALDAIKRAGATNIIIRSVKPAEKGSNQNKGSFYVKYGLTGDDYLALDTLPTIKLKVPMRIFQHEIRNEGEMFLGDVVATTAEYQTVNKFGMEAGRFLSDALDGDSYGDGKDFKNVAVLGTNVATALFPFDDPIGQDIILNKQRYVVIGVIADRLPGGSSAGGKSAEDYNDDVYIPYDTCMHLFGKKIMRREAGGRSGEIVEYHQITVQVGEMSEVRDTGNGIKKILERNHDGKQDWGVIIPLDKLEEAEDTANRYLGLLALIASISLVVGGIGIMNIMLATVTERTREIGIRRALGAKRRDITVQFLVEAVVQTGIGGLLGVLLGLGLVFTIPFLVWRVFGENLPALLNFNWILVAVAVSVGVGVVFGWYPARRASRLDPIERCGIHNGLVMNAGHIRIKNVDFSYEDFHYRTPIKFGGVALDRATTLNVHCDVETISGKTSRGYGSMPLGNVWSFPSRALGYDGTLAAMKALVEHVAARTADHKEAGHPIDLTWALEPSYLQAAKDVQRNLNLPEPIPHLCTLVAASPFDAALHDAFGKVHGLSCYHTYGPEFLGNDVGRYLGAEFKGERLDRYVLREPKERMPLYHLIGALDPLESQDIVTPIDDGLPETLPQWIRQDGLTHLKIKLNGDDLNWDVGRVVRIDQVAGQAQAERGVERWYYSLDFNERCPNVEYLLEMLARVKEQRPAGFERIQYIEQPTARDLKANRQNVMHAASKVRPVVIDESLIDLESLQLARDMGYTGAALKACKGQSQSLLLAAAAQKYGMFLCVQDLTCPGASLIHSAGLAAHVPGVAAIESNARQYVPAANKPWEDRFPGIFRITDGTLHTGSLTGPGLGATN